MQDVKYALIRARDSMKYLAHKKDYVIHALIAYTKADKPKHYHSFALYYMRTALLSDTLKSCQFAIEQAVDAVEKEEAKN